MVINNYKNCQICFRSFLRLHIHHINGNHKDNSSNNRIEICRDCHNSIHKPIRRGRMREYKGDSNIEIIKRIYNLRLKFHQSRYGHTNFIPKDFITNTIINEVRMEKIYDEIRKKSSLIKEIRYC